MIAIIDYGVGNLFSLSSSLAHLGLETVVTKNAEDLNCADQIILPGVGAFADAAQKLRQSALVEPLYEQVRSGKPLLGICLGMQMLFEKSYEYGEHEGLGLIPGVVAPLKEDIPASLKVPHIGWNRLDICKKDPLLRYLSGGEYVYYVHSYYAKNCAPSVLAQSEYHVAVPGVVRNKNVWGCQFHPEKSGPVGLSILKAFSELAGGEKE
ncbi:MAG: imidazole glycerol phosphate synthase subunit HisH [Pygmaiobacter massiliensis]|nr:imidazole glycerol phosphate synthase subunit HisH [Pygmaiobacter massiliensis]